MRMMRAVRRLKNRRGVFVVLFGILFVALMAAGAMAIDFARIWVMRNELQTAADASALAGAVQLGTAAKAAADVTTAVNRYAASNKSMGAATIVDDIQMGQWDDAATTFIKDATPWNAVKVTVSHPTRGLIMQALGVAAPTVHATATAWADAPVSSTSCIRPWAIPYEVLMGRVNPLRLDDPSISGNPYSRANLTRPFDPVKDMDILKTKSPDSLRFSLKIGQNNNANNGNIDDSNLINGQPGNFQAVVLPKWWDYATQSATVPAPSRGGNAYADAIMGKECYKLAVGDSLLTESGNKAGPTVQAVDKSDPQTAPYGVCDSLRVSDKGKTPNIAIHGDCMNSASPTGVGVEIKAAFYFCPTSCSGRSKVTVTLLGSFTLEKVYPDNDGGSTPRWEKSQIVGTFNPVSEVGPVGGSSTMLRRVILVK